MLVIGSFERCMGESGIRSAVGAVVGLSSRWEAGSLLQRACGAMSLGDCTVGMWGFYTDPVSPATLIDFFAGYLADCGDIHWPINQDARIDHYPYGSKLRNHKAHLIFL